MMLSLAKYAMLVLLFLLFFFSIRLLLLSSVRNNAARIRLRHVRSASLGSRILRKLGRYRFIYGHLADLMESTRQRASLGFFLAFSVVLFLLGITFGALLFSNAKGVISLSLVMGFLPYLLLRLRLISIQMSARLDFMPAVEVFYQCYVLSAHKNVRIVLRDALMENRILYPIKPVFEQLQRNLATNRDPEDCLRVFSFSLGHLWADYFINILRVSMMEGNDVSESLRDLIYDMRRAQLSDQADRNRLLEIRIANFSPILFLIVFLAVNFKINPASAYRYYVLDPAGRNMLLDAVMLMFGSFLMGVYLSMKRM